MSRQKVCDHYLQTMLAALLIHSRSTRGHAAKCTIRMLDIWSQNQNIDTRKRIGILVSDVPMAQQPALFKRNIKDSTHFQLIVAERDHLAEVETRQGKVASRLRPSATLPSSVGALNTPKPNQSPSHWPACAQMLEPKTRCLCLNPPRSRCSCPNPPKADAHAQSRCSTRETTDADARGDRCPW